jgi:hypothetical protein
VQVLHKLVVVWACMHGALLLSMLLWLLLLLRMHLHVCVQQCTYISYHVP